MRNLTGGDGALLIPWSPDGAQIAFYSDHDGDFDIYLMNRDGSHLRALTHNTFIDSQPVWSPDGRRIAFVAYPGGQSEIYVVDADGSNLRRLTDNSFADQFPVWWPG
jgi:TolB protein